MDLEAAVRGKLRGRLTVHIRGIGLCQSTTTNTSWLGGGLNISLCF